ncbi:unnamed protein product [Protopolystoma xenopodis]|uniref:RRM domain-containing protein n=1 Tax=Protopolystoma xenopodis TaxID=117903 RepID=A0A448W9Z7_9PLAT|nr:unnamed protein product [Protopolystoma xenopodis]
MDFICIFDNLQLGSKIDSTSFFLRLRGVPFECKEDDVLKFLHGNLDLFSPKRLFEASEDEAKRNAGYQVKSDGTVRLRGLPYDVKKSDIIDFFWGMSILHSITICLEIVPDGIGLLVDHNGEPNGVAFVQFASLEDAERALAKSGERIGNRYIEVFPSSLTEANQTIKGQLSENYSRAPLRGKSREQSRNQNYPPPGIACAALDWSRDGSRYRNRSRDRSWDRSRDRDCFYVDRRGGQAGYGGYGGNFYNGCSQFNGNYRSRQDDYGYGYGYGGARVTRDGPYGYAGVKALRTTRHTVRMRGLPFSATESDVIGFFRPVQAVAARIEYQRPGRPSGYGEADFTSHDEALEAMKRDREQMGNRYIELFLHSESN